MRTLSGIHGSDAVALDDSTPHRHCIRGHRLRNGKVRVSLPLLQKVALRTLAELAVPSSVALEIGPDAGSSPNGNLEQTRIGKHIGVFRY
jgi:hypothetical protein